MLIVVRPRAGPAGTLMTRPCRRIRFAVHHDANVHLAPREGRSSGWRPRTLLAARLHRRRLGLRCSRCWRHLMLAVHSTQRTPRLLPDRVVATTASAGGVRPQVPEPCWQRSRPQHISPYTHTQRRGAAPAAATFAELRITYANTAPEVAQRNHANRGLPTPATRKSAPTVISGSPPALGRDSSDFSAPLRLYRAPLVNE